MRTFINHGPGRTGPLLAGTSTVILASLLAASPAVAQDNESAEADTPFSNEIIVTARFEEESLQDVPLAVTAFDAEAIERRNITELDDVARFTAGFSFEDFDGGNANPAIRGQSTLRPTSREQTVASFLDGVYLPRSWVVDLGTANMQRIEIVKGPQSARYGRNAFAGAINYISERPGSDFAVNGSVTYGNYDRFDISGGLSIPVVKDQLAVRVFYEHTEFDGSWRNDHPNADVGIFPGTNGRVGGWDNSAWSAMAVWTPIDMIEFEVAYSSYDKKEEARAARWLNTGQGDGNCGALQVGGNPSLFCGVFPATGDSVTLDPRGFGRQADIDVLRTSLRLEPTDNLTLFYQFGNIDGTTRSANTAESDPVNCGTILGPPAFPPLCNFQGSPAGSIDYSQHELRLTFDDGGPLRFAVGGFLMDGTDESIAVSANVPPLGTTPNEIRFESFGGFANLVFRDEITQTDVESVFGEATISFNEGRTRLSLEGRYTSETIDTFDLRGNRQIGLETFNFFTPRFTLEHDLTPDTLLYATVARGAKAGGFNSAAISPDLEQYDPEFNWTYELGAKNTLLGGDLILNAAAFYTDWSALQITIIDPLGTPFTPAMITNLGDARIFGAEIEGVFQATENLSFDFAGSYTNAEYKDGTTDAQFTAGTAAFPPPCDDIVCNSNGEIGGNMLERSPEWQFALGTQWAADIDQDFSYFVRGDFSYQSSHFVNQINTAIAPGRTVVHARIGLSYRDRFSLDLWARNLFDEKYVSNSLAIIQPFSNNIIGTYFGERRTFGATISIDYD